MFTGIVEELGQVHAVEPQRDAARYTFVSRTLLDGVRLGDSIAVNGCCLTVVATGRRNRSGPVDLWTADIMQESLDRTSLGALAVGDPVNLERAVRADQRLGGHLVQGHVDAVGTVVRRSPSENWDVVEIALPRDLVPLLVEKGSVTVDGVSLTVVHVTDESFSVSLIPETLHRTTLGSRVVGQSVNLETDVIAKHVARLLDAYLPAVVTRRTANEEVVA